MTDDAQTSDDRPIVEGELVEQIDDGEWSLYFPYPDYIRIAGAWMRNIWIRDVTQPGDVGVNQLSSTGALRGADECAHDTTQLPRGDRVTDTKGAIEQ